MLLNPLTSMIESIRDPLLGLSVNYIVYFILGILFVIQFYLSLFLNTKVNISTIGYKYEKYNYLI